MSLIQDKHKIKEGAIIEVSVMYVIMLGLRCYL